MEKTKSTATNEQKKLAVEIVKSSKEPQRAALEEWAREMLLIRASGLPRHRKIKQAIAATTRREVIIPVVRSVSVELKRIGWDERSWATRLLGAGVLAALASGGQGAGIAALGTAVGLPLWIVFGAGGAFAGTLLDELQKARRSQSR